MWSRGASRAARLNSTAASSNLFFSARATPRLKCASAKLGSRASAFRNSAISLSSSYFSQSATLSLKCFLASAFAERCCRLAQNAGIATRNNKTNTAILFMLVSQPLNQLGLRCLITAAFRCHVPGFRIQGSGVRSQESGVRMKSICFLLSAFCLLLTADCLLPLPPYPYVGLLLWAARWGKRRHRRPLLWSLGCAGCASFSNQHMRTRIIGVVGGQFSVADLKRRSAAAVIRLEHAGIDEENAIVEAGRNGMHG